MCWVCDGVRLEAAPGQLTAMRTDVPREDVMTERWVKGYKEAGMDLGSLLKLDVVIVGARIGDFSA